MKILLINGPNLHMLGKRQPEIYGKQTLEEIEQLCMAEALDQGCQLVCKQSNCEGEIISWITNSPEEFDAIIINAAAYSHTSIAIMDALQSVSLPAIEVHLSNVFKREQFRHYSYVAAACRGSICGLGVSGYLLAIRALLKVKP
jgi:3-dehydroquinate dehydratase-2